MRRRNSPNITQSKQIYKCNKFILGSVSTANKNLFPPKNFISFNQTAFTKEKIKTFVIIVVVVAILWPTSWQTQQYQAINHPKGSKKEVTKSKNSLHTTITLKAQQVKM